MMLNDDERYVFEERLGILGYIGSPDAVQFKIAMDDVDRFREEVKQTNNTEIYDKNRS